jgi:hypothetical protein
MQRAVASVLSSKAPFATALCALVVILAPEQQASLAVAADNSASAPEQPLAITSQGESGEDDGHPGNAVVYDATRSGGVEPSTVTGPSDPLAVDRDYLVQTAVPGDTMTRQGPELAVARLHPEFIHRLAAAIHEAREAGLPSVGVFSAYRPPAFGVGGFSDKFNSLHSYGLAVDITGIGEPGSAEAKLWHEIAARHGVACPYGYANHLEWNHCQPTRIKIILPENPLRRTVTADGPIDLQGMFAAGDQSIESQDEISSDVVTSGSTDLNAVRAETTDNQPSASESVRGIRNIRMAKLSRSVKSGGEPPSWCKHLHRPNKDTCGGSHEVETAAKAQGGHAKQASNLTRHHT